MSAAGAWLIAIVFGSVAAVAAAAAWWAWRWAFRSASMARCTVADAQRAVQLVVQLLTPAPGVLPRRCAACGSPEDPLLAAFDRPGRVAIFYCSDTQACIDRRRAAAVAHR